MKRPLTIDGIAKLAGVNRSTVSRALNPETASLISEEVRKRILAICDEHNYRPRASARAFASGKTQKIALISSTLIHDCSLATYAEYLQALTVAIQNQGYTLTTFVLSLENTEDKEGMLTDYLLSRQADGYFISSSLLTPRLAKVIHGMDRPVIAMSIPPSPRLFNIPTIQKNNIPAYMELFRRIPMDFAGKVLYVGHVNSAESRIKYEEICHTLEMMGRPLDFIVHDFMETPYNSPLVDRHHGMCYAEENLEKLLQYKLIISTDLTALGICDALRRHSIKPGEDIFLAGIDNLEGICHTPDPFLTTIDQGYGQLGTSAGNGMIAAISTGTIPEHELINQATFIRRKSF